MQATKGIWSWKHKPIKMLWNYDGTHTHTYIYIERERERDLVIIISLIYIRGARI